MSEPQLVQDQLVRVRLAASSDEWCEARVLMISPNGVSVALDLDGLVRANKRSGFVAGVLPLLIENGIARGVLTDDEYEIEIAVSDAPT